MPIDSESLTALADSALGLPGTALIEEVHDGVAPTRPLHTSTPPGFDRSDMHEGMNPRVFAESIHRRADLIADAVASIVPSEVAEQPDGRLDSWMPVHNVHTGLCFPPSRRDDSERSTEAGDNTQSQSTIESSSQSSGTLDSVLSATRLTSVARKIWIVAEVEKEYGGTFDEVPTKPVLDAVLKKGIDCYKLDADFTHRRLSDVVRHSLKKRKLTEEEATAVNPTEHVDPAVIYATHLDTHISGFDILERKLLVTALEAYYKNGRSFIHPPNERWYQNLLFEENSGILQSQRTPAHLAAYLNPLNEALRVNEHRIIRPRHRSRVRVRNEM